MSEWKEIRFEDIFEIPLKNGLTKPSRVRGKGLRMVNMKEIFGFDVINDNTPMELVPMTDNEKTSLLQFDDLLFARQSLVESGAGKISIFKGTEETVFESHLIRCRIDKNKALPDFVFYLFKSPFGKNNVSIIVTQTAAAGIKGSDLKNLVFTFPPLPEQRAIASVLSSVDNKIDLLHRQNQTLEKMAETLFRHWFVEEAKAEWEEKPLSNFGKIICGKTPSKKIPEYFDGDIPFIKIPDMHGNTFIFSTDDNLSELGMKSQQNKTLPPKSICVSCIATVGLVSMNSIESQTNQQINAIIPFVEHYRYYLYLQMKYSYDLLHSMASGGTATLNLNTGNFSNIKILNPTNKILISFHNQVEPLFNKIYLNQTQIRTLSTLRDTLLPKLMSGEVRVEM